MATTERWGHGQAAIDVDAREADLTYIECRQRALASRREITSRDVHCVLSCGIQALSVARQATRSAASAGHLAEPMSNTASALATVRPYVMRGTPRGRGGAAPSGVRGSG